MARSSTRIEADPSRLSGGGHPDRDRYPSGYRNGDRSARGGVCRHLRASAVPAFEDHPLSRPGCRRDRSGVGAHKDGGFVTVLLQDTTPGLRVRTEAGGWIEAPPVPSTFVINTGELLELATNGFVRADVHNVVARRRVWSGSRWHFSLVHNPTQLYR